MSVKKISIAISSGKGGTGKTLVSTNLARTFARCSTFSEFHHPPYHPCNSNSLREDTVFRLLFSPGGECVLTLTRDSRAWLWSLDAKGERTFLDPGGDSRIFGAAFSPDGRRVAAAVYRYQGDRLHTGALQVWDAAACEVIAECNLERDFVAQHVRFDGAGERVLAFDAFVPLSPSGKDGEGGKKQEGPLRRKGHVLLWRPGSGTPPLSCVLDQPLAGAFFLPESPAVRLVTCKGGLYDWDPAAGTVQGVRAEEEGVEQIRLSPGSGHAALITRDGSVELLDTRSVGVSATIRDPDGVPFVAAYPGPGARRAVSRPNRTATPARV